MSEAKPAPARPLPLLAAPTAPDERLPLIVERARGFVYGVGLLGITGVRSALAASAVEIAGRLKGVTDKPVLVGVGVGTGETANFEEGRPGAADKDPVALETAEVALPIDLERVLDPKLIQLSIELAGGGGGVAPVERL